MAQATAVAPRPRELFGHPIGLTYLFTTEMWERFSYYGMRAILVLYLTNFLLSPDAYGHVAGLDTLHNFFEHIFGKLDVGGPAFNGHEYVGMAGSSLSHEGIIYRPQFASLIYGIYTAFVYLTPFFGGIVADRWLGQRFTVIVGGIIMAIAEFVLFVPSLFLLGLLFLIIGNGFFKPNISTQVGNLYPPNDSRIDRAFSIFYVGINVGAFFSPFVCGTLGEEVGYHWGFFAAGVGMVIGLITYLIALRTLPNDRMARVKAKNEAAHPPLTRQDWKAIIGLILLCIPVTFFWATYEQQGNTMNLWAQGFTNRALIPGLIDWQIPVTWFQSFNPAMIVAFTPLVVGLWGRQAKRGTEPSTITKMALGLFMLAASYVIMALAAMVSPDGGASWLWLLAFYAVITMGELYLSPIGLALVARVAPAKILSMMMGLWFITSFTGNLVQGYIGTYFSVMSKESFFLMLAAIGAGAGVLTWLFNFPLRPILDAKPIDVGELAEPQAAPHLEPTAQAGE